MKRRCVYCVLALCSLVAGEPAAAKMFFRVAPSSVPSADKTGIQDVVLFWPIQDSSLLAHVRSQGYHAWLQCEAKDLSATVAVAERETLTGIVIAGFGDIGDLEQTRSYLAAHKNLAFRLLITGGKQPQMKGRLVVERDGILQVSSPSTQPWLDTNFASVRLGQSTYSDLAPITYDFPWDKSETPSGAWHPDAEDYALAIAEADAIRSDVIVDLPAALQKELVANNPAAWSLWKGVKAYLDFSTLAPPAKMVPEADVGVIVEDASSNYEAINLMARHNLAFEVAAPSSVTPARLSGWNSVVVFSPLKKDAVEVLRTFAENGGLVVIVNSHGEFPWHSLPLFRQLPHSATYAIGTGQVVELDEPIVDPETFARDLRRLIGKERACLGLWNSLTTLVTAYHEEKRSALVLFLVNYADQPDNVQIRVKGRFSRVRLESPEESCCASLPFVERDGFAEFTVPSLRIAARVHLDSKNADSAAEGNR